VGRRRERRERRAREAQAHPRALGADAPKRADKADERRRAKYAEDRKRLVRRRTIIGLLAFIPLAAWALRLPFSPLEFIGVPAQSGWLLIWAALFGSFLGLTIRLILERRRFERAAANGRPA
jgi:hypothetical protein